MDLILTFHSIDRSGSVLSYSPEAFRRLVEGLLEEGVEFSTMDDLLAPAEAGRDRVLLTFDDGFTSVHRDALPVLAELGVPALMYVVTDWVGRDNRWPTQDPNALTMELMSWGELRELMQGGFEIGSHTANHVKLDRVDASERESELAGSRQRLADELGVEARHFAYPYGLHGPEDPGRVAAHYASAVTTDMRALSATDDPHRLPRIDAYYLRDPERHLPLFGARTRRYLRLRAALRAVRERLVR